MFGGVGVGVLDNGTVVDGVSDGNGVFDDAGVLVSDGVSVGLQIVIVSPF